MPGRWDWLKDEMKGLSMLKNAPTLMKFLKGSFSGPDDVTKCALCPNMCRHACPISIVDGKETTSPAGKSRVALMIEDGVLELNEENQFPIHMCLSCGCCEEWCPFDFSVSDILRPEKEKAMEEGVVYDEFEEFFKNLEDYGLVHGEVGKKESYPEDGDVLYLRGCEFRESHPEVIEKTMQVFDKIDEDAFVLSDENCCGIPAYNAGNTRLFEELARDMAEKINRSNADKVVTSCPSCAYAYRKLYPEHGQDIEVDVLHIVEYLEEKMESLDLDENKGEFTFHEPCQLVNGLEKENSMRNLLENTGIDPKVPRRNGKKTFCCGYGGTTVGRLNEDLASKINKERLDELKELSKNIITSCPTCKKAFEDNDEEVDVYDVAEIFEELL